MEDDDLPLPTLEEVLICNIKTTVEEVSIYRTIATDMLSTLMISSVFSRSIFYGKEQLMIHSTKGSSA